MNNVLITTRVDAALQRFAMALALGYIFGRVTQSFCNFSQSEGAAAPPNEISDQLYALYILYAQRNLFEILLNQTEIRLYLQFFD